MRLLEKLKNTPCERVFQPLEQAMFRRLSGKKSPPTLTVFIINVKLSFLACLNYIER